MEILLTALASYLIGSIPTAFLVLKIKYGIDITEKGSGNVGALNSFEITKSKSTGIMVLAADFLKGLIPVVTIKYLVDGDFILTATALFFSLLGHCFSIWIKFKGGRGLATALGGTIIFLPAIALIWCIIWSIIFALYRKVHAGNIAATIGTQLVSYLLIDKIIILSYPKPEMNIHLVILIFLSLNVILIKHLKPFLQMIRKRN